MITRNCATCAYAISPKENYGTCMLKHDYIWVVLAEGTLCDHTFKGYVTRRNWALRLLQRIFGGWL